MKTPLILFVFCLCFVTICYSQEDSVEAKRGFKKENLFAGGNVTLAFSNGTTVLGLAPYFGYSLNRYIDVAVSTDFSYISQRDNDVLGDKLRRTIFSPGAFVRVFPVKFLFAHAQYEHNFIRLKYIPAQSQGYSYVEHRNNNSVLLGAGYAQGREDGNSFFYLSLMFDVVKGKNSPYTDELGRVLPIIRAGYNIALFQGSRR